MSCDVKLSWQGRKLGGEYYHGANCPIGQDTANFEGGNCPGECPASVRGRGGISGSPCMITSLCGYVAVMICLCHPD